jgi:two-component system, cell cycle sensor histidine kinase and response regulator CckA
LSIIHDITERKQSQATNHELEVQLRQAQKLIVKEVIKFLEVSLSSTIEIHRHISSETAIAFAHATQIHQVLMNLCTNAAHAMEKRGGILEVEVANVDLDATMILPNLEIRRDQYIRLTVSDTGDGMDSVTLERIFDPYFTTKEVGKGSGLGLSVVYGIVKSYDGAITVSSEVGKGTTFHVYLPRIEKDLKTAEEPSSPVPSGSERILLVDDEADLVYAWRIYLERLGYKVVTRTSCLEALELIRVHPDYFDLIITDYTMPHMNGRDLAKQMLCIRPDIPIILCSGWEAKLSDEKARDTSIRAFLMKPLQLLDVAEVIRKVLDEK